MAPEVPIEESIFFNFKLAIISSLRDEGTGQNCSSITNITNKRT